MEWRTVAVIVLVVSLCFFIVPIRVGPDKAVEDAELFARYVARHNKSYRNDSAEYNRRFERFQVNGEISALQIDLVGTAMVGSRFPPSPSPSPRPPARVLIHSFVSRFKYKFHRGIFNGNCLLIPFQLSTNTRARAYYESPECPRCDSVRCINHLYRQRPGRVIKKCQTHWILSALRFFFLLILTYRCVRDCVLSIAFKIFRNKLEHPECASHNKWQ